MRQLHDLVVDGGLLRGLDDLFVGSLGETVFDILLDGAVEDMVLLQHQSDVVAHPLGVPFAKFDAVELDGTPLRFVELIQQVDDGALARTAQSYQCGNLARLDVHRHVKQRLRAVRVGEIDAAQLEVTAHLSGLMCAGGFHLVVSIQNAKEPLGIDERIVHVVVDAVQLSDGRADVGKEHHVVHNLTDGHARIVYQHEVGRQDDNEYGTNLFEETLQTIIKVALFARVQLQSRHVTLDGGLTVGLDLFAVERLDDGDALA